MLAVKGTYDGKKLQLDEKVPFDVPTEVVLVFEAPVKRNNHAKRKYDFSHVAGRLKWNGDAVRTQRKLRDEW